MNWRKWVPTYTVDARAIIVHLTIREHLAKGVVEGLYGLWMFATFAGPVSFGLIGGLVG